MDETEQWLQGGDCSKCRKKKYCKNTCRIAKERMHSVLTSTLMESFVRCMSTGRSKVTATANSEEGEYGE